jgi:hypothetical protein
MGKYLDLVRKVVAEVGVYDQNDKDDQRVGFGRFGRLCRGPSPYEPTVEALERRCPNYVERERWQQAVEDGRRFLTRWGGQAEALGWTARDLFGLHTPPMRPGAFYRRLSRYDETGLVWLLQGRPVVALTEVTAAIQGASGTITVYRKDNKPALGPVGDSLRDLDPRERDA